MTNRFLISVAAAALIAGTGLANAQGPGGNAGTGAPAAQQSAPHSGSGASSGGAMQRDTGGSSGMKSESGMKGSEPGMKAESNDKAQPSSKSAQDSNRMQGEKSKSMHSETDSKAGKDMKAEGRDSKSGEMNNAQTKGTDTKSGTAASETKSGTTTGNAATSATAAPPPEKRAQINTAFRSEKIQETTNVNFNISVGTAVPASVHFHPIPARIVEIYPEWRGYDVILVHGRYVIVRPQTREIVYIIEG
jgi:hypothetical protein